jgi:hypothetical protein
MLPWHRDHHIPAHARVTDTLPVGQTLKVRAFLVSLNKEAFGQNAEFADFVRFNLAGHRLDEDEKIQIINTWLYEQRPW